MRSGGTSMFFVAIVELITFHEASIRRGKQQPMHAESSRTGCHVPKVERAMSALDAAKEKLTISALWQLRDWRGKPGRSCRLPYREDRSPSGSVLPNGRLFHDFTNGETFDAP